MMEWGPFSHLSFENELGQEKNGRFFFCRRQDCFKTNVICVTLEHQRHLKTKPHKSKDLRNYPDTSKYATSCAQEKKKANYFAKLHAGYPRDVVRRFFAQKSRTERDVGRSNMSAPIKRA